MTLEQLQKVQEIWNKANRIIGISETLGMDGEQRMDGISVDDMKLLMTYVVELGKQRDELQKDYDNLDLKLAGVMWFVDKWLDDDELKYPDEVRRALAMREKVLGIIEDLENKPEGQWKFREIPNRSCSINHAIQCSICGYDIEMLQGKRYKFCPNCGAEMKGASNE